MKVWWSLVRKEYLLTKNLVWGGLAIVLIAAFFDVYLAYRYGIGIEIALAFMGVMAHVIYLPVYVWESLSREWKNTAQLWMQSPQSGWFLLSAKLVSGLLAMLISFALTCAFTLWIAVTVNTPIYTVLPWPVVIQYGIWIALLIILSSSYAGLWAMFIFMSGTAAKSFLKRGIPLVYLLAFLVPSWLIGAFEDTFIFEELFRWGIINWNWLYPEAAIPGVTHHPLYLGVIIFYALIAGMLFYLSGWLLDRKVEV